MSQNNYSPKEEASRNAARNQALYFIVLVTPLLLFIVFPKSDLIRKAVFVLSIITNLAFLGLTIKNFFKSEISTL